MAAEECGSDCLPRGRPGSKKQAGQPNLPNFQNLPNIPRLAEEQAF